MEFNKSNRFNNNNETTLKQTLIYYKGEIGEFDYDPNIWEISDDSLKFKNKELQGVSNTQNFTIFVILVQK